MADWKTFDLGFEAVLDPINDGLSGIVSGVAGILQAGVAILNVLSSFLIITNNPILAGVELLRAEIINLLADLSESGVYGLFLVPQTLDELIQYRGGYTKFRQLFISSLNDVDDPNRPQIASTGALGGIILYINSEDPLELILNGIDLFRFFSIPFEVGIPAPINLRAVPAFIGNNTAIKSETLDFLKGDAPAANGFIFEWQEPRYANDVLYDIFGNCKFILERSRSREGVQVLQPLAEQPSSKINPLDKKADRDGRKQKASKAFLDDKGRPVYYWEPVNVNDPFIEASDLFDDLGEGLLQFGFISGSYAYALITDTGLDNAYYYRVRAVPRDATLEVRTGIVYDADGTEKELDFYVLERKGEILSSDTAPASAPVQGYLPDIDTSFDLLTALLNTYRVAYLLRFDSDVYTTAQDLATGSSSLREGILPSIYQTTEGVVFYDNDPGVDIAYYPEPLFDTTITSYEISAEVLGEDLLASAAEFDPFGGVDEFIAPRLDLPPNERIQRAIDQKVDPLVQQIAPGIAKNNGLFELFRQTYTANEALIEGLLTGGLSLSDFNGDNTTRFTIFSLLQLTQGFSTQGQPPNWESIKILESLFPAAAEALNKLFDLILSLENVFQDATSELQNTLQGVEDRLNVVTSLLDQITALIASLTAVLALDFDINMLYIPPEAGGNARVISELVNAGDPPPSDPKDYFLALSLLVGGPSVADVQALVNVLSLIFGV